MKLNGVKLISNYLWLDFEKYLDLIVAVDGYIEFSNKTGYTKIVLNDYHNGVPTGLAYDPSSQTLYFSDQDHEDIHIFSTTLSGTDLESNHQLHHVLQSKYLLTLQPSLHLIGS